MTPLKFLIIKFRLENIIGGFFVSHNIFIKVLRIVLFIPLFFVSLNNMLYSVAYLFGDLAYKKDFLAVYVLSKAIREGINPYIDMPILVSKFVGISSLIFPHPTPYPPSVGIIFLPLSLFKYETAVVLWFIFEIACLIGSLILLVLPSTKHISFSGIAVILILSLLYWPITSELQLGNVNLVLLLIISGMRFAIVKERNILAGILFGFSILIKPLFWPISLYLYLEKIG